jgi:hypothetical protein
VVTQEQKREKKGAREANDSTTERACGDGMQVVKSDAGNLRD